MKLNINLFVRNFDEDGSEHLEHLETFSNVQADPFQVGDEFMIQVMSTTVKGVPPKLAMQIRDQREKFKREYETKVVRIVERSLGSLDYFSDLTPHVNIEYRCEVFDYESHQEEN